MVIQMAKEKEDKRKGSKETGTRNWDPGN